MEEGHGVFDLEQSHQLQQSKNTRKFADRNTEPQYHGDHLPSPVILWLSAFITCLWNNKSQSHGRYKDANPECEREIGQGPIM